MTSISATAASAIRGSDETTIPVVEEQLSVGKREVQKGGVRIISRVIETPSVAIVALSASIGAQDFTTTEAINRAAARR